MKKYQTLRQKYPFFIYRNYQIQKINESKTLDYNIAFSYYMLEKYEDAIVWFEKGP